LSAIEILLSGSLDIGRLLRSSATPVTERSQFSILISEIGLDFSRALIKYGIRLLQSSSYAGSRKKKYRKECPK